ncbi:MAG: efflux RND transporter periplasmic adaptor subunit [Wenzhouxiangella sp.]|nr:MAG: efflux RND transporter periplasmic adaptor subunit [Wenzhouxiangella sp.]
MNKRLIIMLVLATVLFGGIFGFKAFINQVIADVFDNMEPDVVTITATTARTQTWTPRFEAVGSLAPVNGAELTLEMGGIVQAIHFDNGQQVEAGQRLVELDTRVDRAELAQLQSALRLAEQEEARLQRLIEQRSISRAELDRAESEAEQARAAVATRQALIDQKTLVAPFAGRAGIRRVNPGQFIGAGEPIVSLQSLDPIFVDFNLPQRKLPLLADDAEVRISVDAFPDRTFTGLVTAVEPRLDRSTRTLPVQATLDNSDEVLRPGMFARVELDLGPPESLIVIPQTAIRHATYGASVFVIENNGNDDSDDTIVVQRFIRTGTTRGDLVAVTDGLEEGERVASSGLLKLQNKARVRIDDDEAVQPTEDVDPRPDNG